MSSLHHLSITQKFIMLALLISATAWGILDCFQSRIIEGVFKKHVDSDLEIAAREDRGLFDAYLNSFHHSIHLLTAHRKLSEHFLSSDWKNRGKRPIIHHNIPEWLPEESVLHTLPLVHYFLLLDKKGCIGEVFTETTESLPQELQPPASL
ncbi:MAG: hypothetical protein D3908_15115, partial [Candidatus Electrothrix sp. AUS4]|nr:hypothetical protein [Candidatus Electrothrix sp. AUS4]